VKGRKRHILVDTMGLLIAVVVHAAGIQDRDGGRRVIEKARFACTRLQKIWADGGYAGDFVDWVKTFADWTVEIVRRDEEKKGFYVLPRRWIVERTLAWLSRYRRLSKDYETLPRTSENIIYIAMINLMLHRLAPEPNHNGYVMQFQ
jgi:putative transposase